LKQALILFFILKYRFNQKFKLATIFFFSKITKFIFQAQICAQKYFVSEDIWPENIKVQFENLQNTLKENFVLLRSE
jgi:hypothetical protein